jgi:hypothetical protein
VGDGEVAGRDPAAGLGWGFVVAGAGVGRGLGAVGSAAGAVGSAAAGVAAGRFSLGFSVPTMRAMASSIRASSGLPAVPTRVTVRDGW